MMEYVSKWPWRGPLIGPTKSIAQIKQEVAAKYSIRVSDMEGPSVYREHAWPRHEAWALIYAEGFCSTTVIGRHFGGRDHSTVHRGIECHLRRAEAGLNVPEAHVVRERRGLSSDDNRLRCRSRALVRRAAA